MQNRNESKLETSFPKYKLVFWFGVLVLLLGIQAFEAKAHIKSKSLSATQLMKNQKRMILNAIEKAQILEAEVLTYEEDNQYKTLILEMISDGENTLRLCDEDLSNLTCDENQSFQSLNETENLKRSLNANQGRLVKFNQAPSMNLDQVQALYPWYVNEDKAGLILYLGINGNGERQVGLIDALSAVDLVKPQDHNALARFGVIYLIKIGPQGNRN